MKARLRVAQCTPGALSCPLVIVSLYYDLTLAIHAASGSKQLAYGSGRRGIANRQADRCLCLCVSPVAIVGRLQGDALITN